MTDVVEQRRGDGHARVLIGEPAPFRRRTQVVDRQPSEVHDAQRVFEPRVPGAGPDSRDESELLNPLEAGEGRRSDQRDLGTGQRDAVVEGVADSRFDGESGGRRSAMSKSWHEA